MDMLLAPSCFFIDPVQVFKNSGIDTRLVLLPTVVSPAHYTIDIVYLILLTGERPTRVTLSGRDNNDISQRNDYFSFQFLKMSF